MRIQHNIAALSSYRNLTNNNSAVAKNLEKLSSGYRINRAGDDAAGLAISEKMRAQITGLNTAQKNANDGISLVQTAEGALTEVHSMLNRMVELANQSANGTYADKVDRENLQAEVDSLLEEIDRISQSTNFNGINLLDGTMSATTTAAEDAVTDLKDITASKLTHIADGAKPNDPKKAKFTLDLTSLEMRNDGVATDITDPGITTSATEGDATTKASVTFELAGAEVNLSDDATSTTVKINIGGQEFEIDQDADGDDDGTISAEELRTALVNQTITIKDDAGNDVVLTGVAGGTDTEIKFEAAAMGATTGVVNALDNKDVTITDGGNNATVTAGIYFGGTELGSTTIAKGATMTGAQWATAFMNSLTANADGNKTVTIDNVEYKVTNDSGKLTFEMTEDPTSDFTTNLTAELKVTNSAKTDTYAEAGNNAKSDDATINKDNDRGVFINQGNGIGVHMEQEAVAAGNRVLAQGSLDLNGVVKDGAALKIGNETYVFAVGKDSKFAKNSNVIDLTDYETVDTNALKKAAKELSKVAAGNKMFDVSTDNISGTIRLTERKDSGIDYTVNKLNGTTDANLFDATVAAWKDLIQVGVANANPKAASTTDGLTLQIGDTSKDFNKLKVSIDNMDAESLGIGGLKINTQTAAAEAVDKIKNAINKVSSQRGTLGAIQNRLEHTINNLSVTAENITAAESRIRDVDMAEEMMAYTKNNILVQASQAMLAQANQIPQGVLQLLQ